MSDDEEKPALFLSSTTLSHPGLKWGETGG